MDGPILQVDDEECCLAGSLALVIGIRNKIKLFSGEKYWFSWEKDSSSQFLKSGDKKFWSLVPCSSFKFEHETWFDWHFLPRLKLLYGAIRQKFANKTEAT